MFHINDVLRNAFISYKGWVTAWSSYWASRVLGPPRTPYSVSYTVFGSCMFYFKGKFTQLLPVFIKMAVFFVRLNGQNYFHLSFWRYSRRNPLATRGIRFLTCRQSFLILTMIIVLGHVALFSKGFHATTRRVVCFRCLGCTRMRRFCWVWRMLMLLNGSFQIKWKDGKGKEIEEWLRKPNTEP